MTLSDRNSHTNGCTDDHQSDRCGDACGIKYDEKHCCCANGKDEDGDQYGSHLCTYAKSNSMVNNDPMQEECVYGGQHEISFVETDSYCFDWHFGVLQVQEKCTICGKIFQSEYTLTKRVVDRDQEHQLEEESK